MTQIITQLRTDFDGPGSFDELVKRTVEELKRNFQPNLDSNDDYDGVFVQRATEIVNLILSDLDIEVQYM